MSASWSHAGRMPTREGDRQEHHCHLPRGLSAGGCEPHWPGLLTRVGLKSEGREGHRTRPLCRLRAQVVPTPPQGTSVCLALLVGPCTLSPGIVWPPTTSSVQRFLKRWQKALIAVPGEGSPLQVR